MSCLLVKMNMTSAGSRQTVEVNLCGHATLATTHTLHKMGYAKPGDTLSFNTKSGKLKAFIQENGEIELDLPLQAGEPCEQDPAFSALGVEIMNCERNVENDLVEVSDFEALIACAPNFRDLGEMKMQGVIVTTATDVPEGFDFASRYFGPNCGVNEDAVTGSAHCFLAPYWSERLGKTKFRAFQASIGRGELGVELKGDRVLVSGKCITSIRGAIPELEKVTRKASAAPASKPATPVKTELTAEEALRAEEKVRRIKEKLGIMEQ